MTDLILLLNKRLNVIAMVVIVLIVSGGVIGPVYSVYQVLVVRKVIITIW